MAPPKVDRQELIELLHEWNEALDPAEDCAIEINHIGSGDEPIATFRMDRKVDRMALAGKIADRMERFTKGFKALCKFMLVAKHGSTLNPLGSLPFTVEYGVFGNTGSERRYEESEPATDAGERAQRMRFYNEDHRIRLAGSMDIMGAYQRQNDQLEQRILARDATIERLTQQNAEQYIAYQEAEDRKTERETRLYQLQREMEQKDKNIQAFWAIAPIVAIRFLPNDLKDLARPLVTMLQQTFARSATTPQLVRAPGAPAPPKAAPAASGGIHATGPKAAPAAAPVEAEVETEAVPDNGGTPIEMFLATLKPAQRTLLLQNLNIDQQKIFFDMEKSPTTANVKRLVDSLDSFEELMSLASALTQEQQTMLMLVVNEVIDEAPAQGSAQAAE